MATLTDVIKTYSSVPMEESIPHVAAALREQSLLVPLATPPEENSNQVELLIALDANQDPWVYVYSDEDELTRVLPQGTVYARMPIGDFLAMIATGPDMRGILIDSGSKHAFPVPSELFAALIEPAA